MSVYGGPQTLANFVVGHEQQVLWVQVLGIDCEMANSKMSSFLRREHMSPDFGLPGDIPTL